MMRRIGLVVIAAVVGVAAGCGSTVTPAGPGGPRPLPAFAPSAGRSSGAAPALFPLPGSVEYRVGSLPDVAAHAPAYRVAGDTTTGRVARLAAAFGVDGPVTSGDGGWSVGTGDKTVHVERLGGLPWTFSAQTGGGAAGSGCTIAIPASPPGSPSSSPPEPLPTCPPPTTVPGLPSQDAAVQVAKSVLANAGFD